MTYASFGKRFLAFLLDSLILSAISVPFYFIFNEYVYSSAVAAASAFYFILFEGSESGATLGKKALGIKVTDIYGNRISYGTAIARYFSRILSSILFIGYIIAAFDDNSQALHDKLAKTVVINKVSEYNAQPAYVSPPAPAPAQQGGAVRIVGISGAFAGQGFLVTNNGIMIGRDPNSCQIVFAQDTPCISRIHCKVTYEPVSGLCTINDLGSSYGTFTGNGVRINSVPTALHVGERFYLGNPQNTFEIQY